ncbi:MAG: hypothetical protein GX620_06945, partial [Chloroflexi bacterium]|nr:hypothetical protein [Chloroflexota bacterium]
VLWRSLVWAARKPFALRCLPPLVAMRVDDVCGLGEAWGQSPLYWVEIANQNGFRPWLGLFLHNLSNGAIDQLRGLLLGGTASAFPHALGRPVKDGAGDRDSARISMPLRTSAQDEFIYFDHHGGRPWPDRELDRRVAVVDAWYAQTTLPVSSYALPHWYEMGRNCARYLADTWHVQFLGLCSQPGSVFGRDTPWLRAAPFRLYEDAGTCYFHKDDRGLQPVYYADWIDVDDRRFFNSLVEIRGAPDYEWEPDNDVTATAQRGICHLLRALDSLALAVLFTHETDHIRDIRPDSWDATLSQISKGIAGHSPQFVTIDMAAQYQRAMCTSRLAAADYDPEQNAILLRLTGHTDLPTHVRVFLESDDGVGSTYVEAPALEGEVVLSVAVKDLTVSPC